ncbi:hypothetical protein C0993_001597 [Termitomyces sp. T159_Od127]|nr:hypothetical protein C0993_001597 [Termitomyces sp. T159_Od127]
MQTNTGEQQQSNGSSSSAGGRRYDQATTQFPNDPCQGSEGGSPQRAQAKQAKVEINTAESTIEVPDPQNMEGPKTGEVNQESLNNKNRVGATTSPIQTADNNTLRLDQSKVTNRENEEPSEPIPNLNADQDLLREHPEMQARHQGNMTGPAKSRDDRRAIATEKQKAPWKGALKIAILNIKGAGSTSTEHKWSEINNLMNKEKIDVLTVQETHLTERNKKQLNEIYGKRMHIISTLDESTPNMMGIAVILSKRATK